MWTLDWPTILLIGSALVGVSHVAFHTLGVICLRPKGDNGRWTLMKSIKSGLLAPTTVNFIDKSPSSTGFSHSSLEMLESSPPFTIEA